MEIVPERSRSSQKLFRWLCWRLETGTDHHEKEQEICSVCNAVPDGTFRTFTKRFTTKVHGRKIAVMRLTILFILSGLLSQSFPQSAKWHANVQVKYAGSDAFESQIKSYISRELRALGDVDQTETKPDYIIMIFSIETHAGERLNGYAVHVTVTYPIERFVELLHVDFNISPDLCAPAACGMRAEA